MTREEAVEELEFALDIAYKIAWGIEHKIFIRKIKRKEWRENHQNAIESLIMGINSLKTNPCDNCIGPGLAITHGYKNMKIRNPEVEG